MAANVVHMESYLRLAGEKHRQYHIEENNRVRECLTKNLKVGTPPMFIYKELNRKPSSVPFKTLKMTVLKQLNTNEEATGKFLVLRTLEPAYCIDQHVVHVVEDRLGSIIFLHLYNYFLVRQDELDDYFPNGTIIFIKEPYCELTTDSLVIRVDHPTDVIVVRSCDLQYSLFLSIDWVNKIDQSDNQLLAEPKPSNAEEWKKRGNDLFLASKYYSAEVAYKLCITETNKSRDKTVKNLAMKNLISVYLRLEQFDEAVDMAKRVLKQDPNDSKALFRLGCAYYELRKYSKAVKYLEKLYQVDPKDASNNRQLLRARLRVKEQNTGNYNVEHLYQQSKERILGTDKKKLIDVADYVRDVKINKIDGKSVGVVATQDIKPGTLLVVSKALQVIFNNNRVPVSTKDNLEVSLKDAVALGNRAQQLSTAVCVAVYKNFKTVGKQIYDLLQPGVEQRYCDMQNKKEPIFPANEIAKLVYIKSRRINDKEDGPLIRLNDFMNSSSGLFTFPSHIKHSCLPNCSSIIYNNVMIIRALWPINKGEEITICHVNPFELDLVNRQKLLQRLGYACDCLLCQLDEQDGAECLKIRTAHVGNWVFYSGRTFVSVNFCDDVLIRMMQRHIDDIRGTYVESGRTRLQTELFHPYMILSFAYWNRQRFEAMRSTIIKAINCLGLQLDDFDKLMSLGKGKKGSWKSAALELKGKVHLGEELLRAIAILMNSLLRPDAIFAHFKEADTILEANKYLMNLILGDENLIPIINPFAGPLQLTLDMFKNRYASH